MISKAVILEESNPIAVVSRPEPGSKSIVSILRDYDPITNERPSWEQFFSAQALIASFRSPSKKLQVGAVITRNHRVISTGYNGFLAGVPHISIHRDGHEINTVHAEQNAIADASKRGVSIDDSTIYITHYPCINCAKMIISSGIKQVYYLDDYKNDKVVEELFKLAQVKVRQVK